MFYKKKNKNSNIKCIVVTFTVKCYKPMKMNSLQPPATALWLKPQTTEYIRNTFLTTKFKRRREQMIMLANAYLNNDTEKPKCEAVIAIVSRRWVTLVRLEGMLWMGGSAEGCWSTGSDFVFDLGGFYTACLLIIT